MCRSRRSTRTSRTKTDDAKEDVHQVDLGTIEIDTLSSTKQDKWKEYLSVQDMNVLFKLDTGAMASVLPLREIERMDPQPNVVPTETVLKGFNNSTSKPLGTVQLETAYKGRALTVAYYVVEDVKSAILGQNECEALGLLQRIGSCSVTKGDEKEKQRVLDRYTEVFSGIGEMREEYDIRTDTKIRPEQQPPRKLPFAKLEKLKETLDDLKKDGIITDEPGYTPWVSNLVVTEKKSGELRICLDPRPLNKAIMRDPFPPPDMEFIHSSLSGKRIFTVIDQSSAFWQVKLNERSSKLCSFHTPWGKMRFKRMPFGIRCASDVLQRRNNEIFGNIPGVHCSADDILIAADSDEEHDRIFSEVMKRAMLHNIRFNPRKIQYKVPSVKYLGHIQGKTGIAVDPEKIRAIVHMPKPRDVGELRRYLGMVQYLSRFIPHESTITAPLRELLKKEAEWSWNTEHDAALEKIKLLLTSAPVLKPFDLRKSAHIQADASQNGLGACLIQEGRVVAYASRAMTTTEQRYAQIEKELLAICYACERFRQYILGNSTIVESDHKPLEMIFKKQIHLAPLRLQRMLLRLQPYDLNVQYIQGSEMYVADALSRATVDPPEEYLGQEWLIYDIKTITNTSTDTRLGEFKAETASDQELQSLAHIIKTGWPKEIKLLHHQLRPYWSVRDRLTVLEGVIFMGERLVVPASMRKHILDILHGSHFGAEKCKSRAMQAVYWPRILKEIEDQVAHCQICQRHQRTNIKEPMLPHEIPAIPWTKVGGDILDFQGTYYLMVVDYTSKFPELATLGKTKTAAAVITKLKAIFARFGIPREFMADNMPFASREMVQFAKEWGFKITTSSPTYSQSNGKSESAVKMAKAVLQKALEDNRMDVQLAMLHYRNSPVAGMKHSPAEILFSRRLRDDLPRSEESLKPCVVNVMPEIQKAQRRQKQYYDRTTKEKPDFDQGEQVMVQRGSHWEPAVVIEKLPEPRSYRLDNGLRRTSFHLRPCPAKTEDNSVRNDNKNTETDNEHERLDTEDRELQAPEEQPTLGRSTRNRKEPDRYGEWSH